MDAHIAQVIVCVAFDEPIDKRSAIGHRCGDLLALRVNIAMYLSCFQAKFFKQKILYSTVYALTLFFLFLVFLDLFWNDKLHCKPACVVFLVRVNEFPQ